MNSTDKAAERTADNHSAIGKNMRKILKELGEDPSREGLRDTPGRYTSAMRFLTSGYKKTGRSVVGNALFTADSSDIVVIRDIELFSLCEHHLLPFYGKAHVAYIPSKKIIGLSKVPRIVDVFARRLQVQERLTAQIAEELKKILNPSGVAVIIEAFHLCMMMRGVEKQQSYTITSAMHGDFRDDPVCRQELMHLLGGLGNKGRH
ncbi:MAG TPA: GTP cyclohydrolase I FolE [Bdellovibrionales bacterium]|nr:GTP cyclohydrolase I FolE [Bdellovibrionales bacterium]HCM40099.1 GTP cyclohydrolase I FolE [Bdellovibrionales bacterium]